MANNKSPQSERVSLIIANMVKEIELAYNLSNGLSESQITSIKSQFTSIFDEE